MVPSSLIFPGCWLAPIEDWLLLLNRVHLASSSLSNKVLYHQVVIAKRLQIERDLFCISLEDLSEQDDKALFISLGVDQIVSEMA
jgi:hypothetical protein